MHGDIFNALRACLDAERPVAIATIVDLDARRKSDGPAEPGGLDGPHLGRQRLIDHEGMTVGSLGSDALDAAVQASAEQAMTRFAGQRLTLEHAGRSVDVFVDVYPPRRTLIIVGAVHTAIPLVTFAGTLGFRTVVVDPRRAFATRERFPQADVIDTDWPTAAMDRIGLHAGTFVATLSHDLKLDVPALSAALRSPARYIGALGSKKTHAKRLAVLRDEGFGNDELGRIHSPIGLDLGGRRAEEIAVAIAAQLVAVDQGHATGARA